MADGRRLLARAIRVLSVEAKAVEELKERLDENFARAVELLLATRGKVVVTGMGKSGLVGRKISATMASRLWQNATHLATLNIPEKIG